MGMSANGKFLKGQLLLDGGDLGGSFFHASVVLICQHDAEGAFGLVLNQSLGKTVGEMIVADLPDPLKESPLYLGGPVQPAALSFLHTDNFIPDADVLPNLALGHSLDELLEIGESFSPAKKVKMFAGYAGWSPGQLEMEMKRKAWLTFPASLELVFETPPEQLWQKILQEQGRLEKQAALPNAGGFVAELNATMKTDFVEDGLSPISPRQRSLDCRKSIEAKYADRTGNRRRRSKNCKSIPNAGEEFLRRRKRDTSRHRELCGRNAASASGQRCDADLPSIRLDAQQCRV